jgi:hypothetical protein
MNPPQYHTVIAWGSVISGITAGFFIGFVVGWNGGCRAQIEAVNRACAGRGIHFTIDG